MTSSPFSLTKRTALSILWCWRDPSTCLLVQQVQPQQVLQPLQRAL
jgi:hypothetical protein